MLPIETVLPALCAALREKANAVLIAAPGAGKTTRAPLALLNEPWAKTGKLILLSPRRITARAAASQLARQLGEEVGQTIGLRVRLESRVSAATRLEVVTEGVFSRMLLADPTLDGVAGVMFDEFHERHLDADLGLTLALDAQAGLRPDLRLLVMSATLDADRVAGLMGQAEGQAEVIVCEGRSFPVDIRHIGRGAPRPIEDVMADAIARALREEPGDVLAFLPGQREIERVRERLEARSLDQSIDLRPLFGQMDARAQDVAIAPSEPGRRKVVLATAIAESSLTIDGVRVVVDAGLARKPKFEPQLGLMRLETMRASQAAVAQRTGRAGRTQPGVCYRLWDAGETRALPAYDAPEILEADLSGLALDLAEWGAAPSALSWMDAPPPAAFAAAQSVLKDIAAMDQDGRLSAHGRQIARLPLPPRLAHMLAAAGPLSPTAAAAAVLLSEQGLGGREADLSVRLERWRRENGPRARGAMELRRRLQRAVGGSGEPDPDDLGAMLALAFPDRIARRRGQSGAEFLMANGRAAQLDADDPLSKCEWIVIADATGQAQRARLQAAAALDEATVAVILKQRAQEAAVAQYDHPARAIRARRVVRLGAIVVKESPEAAPGEAVLRAAWAQGVKTYGLGILPGAEEVEALLARIAFMRTLEADLWPALSAADLVDTLDDWAGEVLGQARTAAEIAPDALRRAAEGLIGYDLLRRVDLEAPRHFQTPLGAQVLIDYACEGGPAVDIRLQALFGQTRHPMLASGRTPLLLRLLSPAQRPVQTTRDLPGFWAGSYAQVRSDMRGRYPKHPWPDDPTKAEPTLKRKPAS